MRRFKSFISLIAVSLIVTSCAAGPNAQTTTQGPTGSGDYAKVGDIYVQNVVIVKGNENVGTVVATLINDSTEDDQLVSVSVDNPAPKSVVFSPAN